MTTDNIINIKRIIEKDKKTDGDFWLNGGNETIYEILDTFTDSDWQQLDKDLIHFKDHEHSIFARAILHYDENREIEVDNYEFFFKAFVLLKDYEDCDCLLFDIMYIENIKNPDLALLNNVRSKIKFLENSGFSTNEDLLNSAYNSIEKVMKKRFG